MRTLRQRGENRFAAAQIRDHEQLAVKKFSALPARAKIFPSKAPTTSTGKNNPPGAFVPKHISV